MYKYDLRNEKETKPPAILPEGRRCFRVLEATQRTNRKSGKDYIWLKLLDEKTCNEIPAYLNIEKGKAWRLKNFFSCLQKNYPERFADLDEDEDGNGLYSLLDWTLIIGLRVVGENKVVRQKQVDSNTGIVSEGNLKNDIVRFYEFNEEEKKTSSIEDDSAIDNKEVF